MSAQNQKKRLDQLLQTTRLDLVPLHVYPQLKNATLNKLALSSVSTPPSLQIAAPIKKKNEKDKSRVKIPTVGSYAFDAELAPSKAIIFDLALSNTPLPDSTKKKRGFW